MSRATRSRARRSRPSPSALPVRRGVLLGRSPDAGQQRNSPVPFGRCVTDLDAREAFAAAISLGADLGHRGSLARRSSSSSFGDRVDPGLPECVIRLDALPRTVGRRLAPLSAPQREHRIQVSPSRWSTSPVWPKIRQRSLRHHGTIPAPRPAIGMATQIERRLLVNAEAAQLLGCSVPTVKRLADRSAPSEVLHGCPPA